MSDAELALAMLSVGLFWMYFMCLFLKAGYSSGRSVLMAIGMCLPPINIFLAIYFIAVTWPIEHEVAGLRARVGIATPGDAQAVLSAAIKLEASGDAVAAIAKYEEVKKRFPGTEAAQDAESSIRTLKQ